MKKAILVIAIAFISMSAAAQQKAPADTTKKTQEPYYLIGTIDGFQLLFAAVTTPGDVTPNQLKILSDWISTGVQKVPVADSTKIPGKK